MKKFRKLKSAFALFLALLLLPASVTACGSSDEADDADSSADADTSDESSSDELKVIKIGVGGSESTYAMEVGNLAYEYGYFEEELNAVGYTLEIYAFTNTGTEVNEALASGDLDAAIYGDFPAFTSKSNGIDTTVVATLNQRMQYSLISANEDVTSAQDLEGSSVVYVFGSVQQYFWEKYVEATGIDADLVEIINSSDAASLLATGSADAAAANTYLGAYYESLGVGTVIDDGSNYDIFTTTVLIITDSLLEEAPEVAVAFNKALIRAYEAAVADPDTYFEVIESDTIPADCYAAAYAFDDTLWYISPEIADSTLEYYEELSSWLYENGITQSEVDVSEFIDTSYYEQAVEELEQE